MRKSAVLSLTVLALSTGSAMGNSMTLVEQNQEAERLKALCAEDPDVLSAAQRVANGSVAASYEMSAALIQCFYDNVDARYPEESKAQWLEAIEANKQQARTLQ